jgi:hypothetical protein
MFHVVRVSAYGARHVGPKLLLWVDYRPMFLVHWRLSLLQCYILLATNPRRALSVFCQHSVQSRREIGNSIYLV